MVSSYLPYPLFSGGQVRLYNLIKELSSKHEITLLCEKRSDQTDDDIKAVEKICKKVITVNRRKQWTAENILKSGTSSNSFLLTGHTHPEMKQKIKDELAAEWYDFIHVETYYVMQNLPEVFIPVVLVEHNIEYKVYKRYVERAPIVSRPLLAVDVMKIKKEEEEFWKRAEALVAVSKDDQEVMQQAGLKPALVPNGVNTGVFAFKDTSVAIAQKEKRILFIGDFKWIQNKDSISYIINEVWPEIRKKFSSVILNKMKNPHQEDPSARRLRGSPLAAAPQDDNLKLWIVGRSIPDTIRNLTNDPNVLFDEASSAKPTPEIFQEASVLLAPIRVGGGTSYKILESMSCGTPVVTMKLSADSLEAKDGEELLVGQSAEELALKTHRLLQERDLYEKISKGGRAFVESKYTWKEIAKKLDEVYTKVVESKIV